MKRACRLGDCNCGIVVVSRFHCLVGLFGVRWIVFLSLRVGLGLGYLGGGDGLVLCGGGSLAELYLLVADLLMSFSRSCI